MPMARAEELHHVKADISLICPILITDDATGYNYFVYAHSAVHSESHAHRLRILPSGASELTAIAQWTNHTHYTSGFGFKHKHQWYMFLVSGLQSQYDVMKIHPKDFTLSFVAGGVLGNAYSIAVCFTVNDVAHAVIYCPTSGEYAMFVVADILHSGLSDPPMCTGRWKRGWTHIEPRVAVGNRRDKQIRQRFYCYSQRSGLLSVEQVFLHRKVPAPRAYPQAKGPGCQMLGLSLGNETGVLLYKSHFADIESNMLFALSPPEKPRPPGAPTGRRTGGTSPGHSTALMAPAPTGGPAPAAARRRSPSGRAASAAPRRRSSATQLSVPRVLDRLYCTMRRSTGPWTRMDLLPRPIPTAMHTAIHTLWRPPTALHFLCYNAPDGLLWVGRLCLTTADLFATPPQALPHDSDTYVPPPQPLRHPGGSLDRRPQVTFAKQASASPLLGTNNSFAVHETPDSPVCCGDSSAPGSDACLVRLEPLSPRSALDSPSSPRACKAMSPFGAHQTLAEAEATLCILQQPKPPVPPSLQPVPGRVSVRPGTAGPVGRLPSATRGSGWPSTARDRRHLVTGSWAAGVDCPTLNRLEPGSPEAFSASLRSPTSSGSPKTSGRRLGYEMTLRQRVTKAMAEMHQLPMVPTGSDMVAPGSPLLVHDGVRASLPRWDECYGLPPESSVACDAPPVLQRCRVGSCAGDAVDSDVADLMDLLGGKEGLEELVGGPLLLWPGRRATTCAADVPPTEHPPTSAAQSALGLLPAANRTSLQNGAFLALWPTTKPPQWVSSDAGEVQACACPITTPERRPCIPPISSCVRTSAPDIILPATPCAVDAKESEGAVEEGEAATPRVEDAVDGGAASGLLDVQGARDSATPKWEIDRDSSSSSGGDTLQPECSIKEEAMFVEECGAPCFHEDAELLLSAKGHAECIPDSPQGTRAPAQSPALPVDIDDDAAPTTPSGDLPRPERTIWGE